MTCHDAREQLSALLDDALTVPERSVLDTHLATCADCRRELDQLRGTVTLLTRLGPVHAPAGFVDRVMTEAYRPSRIRRLLDALFRPLRVKLPLEAAVVLLIGISALYVYERTPEMRQLTREKTPAPPVAAPPPVAGTASEAPAAQTGAAQAKIAPAEQELAHQGTTPTPPAVTPPAASTVPAPGTNALEAPGASAGVQPAPMTDLRSEAPPAAKPEMKPDVKKEAQAEQRRDASTTPPAAAKVETRAKSAEPAPSRDAMTTRTGPASSPSESAPPATAAAPVPGARGNVGGLSAAAPAAPAREGGSGDAAAQKSRAAARLMRAVDASGRLVVPASEPAEIALDALLSRLGATRVARRVERPPGPILVDVNVPAARYHELLEGLGHIGRWTTEHESKTFHPEIRLEVAIFTEP
jgi:anti-sigma factor RsiW